MRARPAGLVVSATLVAACAAHSTTAFLPSGGHRGGVLRVGITAPAGLDPASDADPASDLLVRATCDTLLTTDPADGRLRPGLAESWLVTDGGSKLVLQMRKGLRFSDGAPLTAADVSYSLSRLASAELASPAADRLRRVLGYPQVHGDVSTDSDTDRRRLAGVRSTDARTVEIALSEPFGEFARVLTDRATAPVERRAAERDPAAFSRRPVCAGPYRPDGPVRPGQTAIRLVRSPYYAGGDPGLSAGGTGYADQLDVEVFASAREAARAELAGRVDVAAATPSDTAQVVAPGGQVEYVGLPVTVPPFDRPAVRRALALALSRRRLVEVVSPAGRDPATGFVPAGTGAGQDCDALPVEADPEAARAALAAAHTDLRGLRVELAFNDELRNRAVVTEVARQWRETVGLDAVPAPVDFAHYLATGSGLHGFAGPFRFSWSGLGVDDYLRPLFATDGIGRDNFSRVSDAAIDEALHRTATRATDPANRRLAYRHVADLVCAAMPMIPVMTTRARWLVGPHVVAAGRTLVDASSGQFLLREAALRA